MYQFVLSSTLSRPQLSKINRAINLIFLNPQPNPAKENNQHIHMRETRHRKNFRSKKSPLINSNQKILLQISPENPSNKRNVTIKSFYFLNHSSIKTFFKTLINSRQSSSISLQIYSKTQQIFHPNNRLILKLSIKMNRIICNRHS